MVTKMATKENNDKILEYLKSHSQATEDEIAKDLQLNVVDVLDSLITMEKAGLLKSIPD
jgi:predicted ArsR family transcriptional regulator